MKAFVLRAVVGLTVAIFDPHTPLSTLVIADETAAFEVASVKPASPTMAAARGISAQPKQSGDLVTWIATVPMMICYAYDIQPFQLQQGHGQAGLYEINAKTEGPNTEKQIRLMFQDLLRNRFSFTFHREAKERPIYVITVVRGGPRLTEYRERRAPWIVSGTPALEGIITNHASRDDPHHLVGHKVTLSALARYLGRAIGSVVVDQTGLTGYYDFELRWWTDERVFDPPDPAAVSAAMQRELGLRLDATRGPVDTFVVDRLEKPTNN